jgi:MFS family permease
LNNRKRKRLQAPYIWAFTTYFAEGFPYTVIRIISSVFFRDMRVSLEAIGLTSLFGLPWVLKFLWGPQIDQYGTKRRWMLTMQFLLVVMVIAVALLSPLPQGIRIIAILFFIGSFVAATHDMAIDGYYMEALDRKGQAKFVGYRVMAYRISMMTGTGVIVTIGATTDWLVAFLAAGALLSILFIYHLFHTQLFQGFPQVEINHRDCLGCVYHHRSAINLCFRMVSATQLPFTHIRQDPICGLGRHRSSGSSLPPCHFQRSDKRDFLERQGFILFQGLHGLHGS